MIAILLDPHESSEEWVGVDSPVREAIARHLDEKRRHLHGLRHREGRAEANGIEAGHDERTWVQSRITESSEQHVGAIHAGPGSRPLPEELRSKKAKAAALGKKGDA